MNNSHPQNFSIPFKGCNENDQGTSMKPCVYLRDYDLIFKDLPDLVDKHAWNSILLGKKIAYSGGSSYAIYNALPSKKVTFQASPVMLMKASKNKVWKSIYCEIYITIDIITKCSWIDK